MTVKAPKFIPDVPLGFQSADNFLRKYTDRPEVAMLLADARKRVQKAREASGVRSGGLAGIRRAAGLSQKQLADQVGTAQPVISMYESGEREPALGTIIALADALGIRYDELIPALKNGR